MGMVPQAQTINTELPKLFFILEEPKGDGEDSPPGLFLGEGGLCIGPYSLESILLTDLFWDMLPK